ncbi:MAG: 2-C-methyl-D-erythritol 2,4-cyclodiphosphate synthase [Desulfobacterales bacterium]|nr:2-C-methyl-D-erythritol 2,4-cyclodiphosphate synthase [Desulfobacterales bacterium]
MRAGLGYDVHRLAKGRKLMLGGVEISFEKGLLGHSDADVLLHALCDAMLGAAGLGDIGMHFPGTDSRYKNISSLVLLESTRVMIRNAGYMVENIDATVFAQAPKIAPYRTAIQKSIASALQLEIDAVNIKATTTEGLGTIGEGEGIGAMCVALLKKR